MNTHHVVIYCTCPDQGIAERIATIVVNERLAACVNIVPAITSIYRWQERVQSDQELLLIIKTRSDIYPALETRIRGLHPYQVVEIIALPILQGSSDYLAWLDASLVNAPATPTNNGQQGEATP
jgi:periplasmic divalent cation tolerance protein